MGSHGDPPAQQPPSCYAASPPHRPRPSFLFSIKNWKEESWKRAKRGPLDASLLLRRERRWWLWGGGPQERGVGALGGGGDPHVWKEGGYVGAYTDHKDQKE
nr:hypothetical protein [Morchella crassipes]